MFFFNEIFVSEQPYQMFISNYERFNCNNIRIHF